MTHWVVTPEKYGQYVHSVPKQMTYYKNSTVEQKDRIRERIKRNKQRNLDAVRSIKSTLSCVVCGESHIATLDFHHKDAGTKYMSVSNMCVNGYALARIFEEIEKCEVLCSNCHRKKHYYSGIV